MAGIRVLHLADHASRLCAALLADLGARVIGIEDPGNSLTGAPPSSSCLSPNRTKSLHNLQNRVETIAFRRLIEQSDVLLEGCRPGHRESLGLGWRQLRRINSRLIHISISGFGQTGPGKNYIGCDAVYAAFGGQMYITGIRSGTPLKLFGPQTYNTASLFAANAVILNLRRRRITGAGCHVDLSIQESVASTLDHVLVNYFHDGTVAARQGDEYAQEPFTVIRCRDGFIQIPILRNWATLREFLISEGHAGNLQEKAWQDVAYCRKNYGVLVEEVQRWAQRYTKHKLFQLGQTMGFPWAPIATMEEVRQSPQLKARGFFRRIARTAGCRRSISGVPYILHSGGVKYTAPPKDGKLPDRAAGSGDILRGIRVLDFTRMIAGPCATRILGDFGAEVIKVQSHLTASGAEKNDTPAFCAWNRNKRSVGLNLNKPEARELLLELVSVSDIVVENFSPRVLFNWGLTYRRLKAVRPNLIMASISAMGQSGPWKNFVGFAPTFHALSGLTAATSQSLNAPAGIGYAFGDIITGLYASLAILAAIENRDRTGSGQYIDLAAYEALCSLALSAEENDRDAGFSGCFPCSGNDRWCVVSVQGDKEWQAFSKIIKHPEWTAARFSMLTKAGKNRMALDAIIRSWTTGHRAETIVRRLQKEGIAAGVVQTAADLAADRQLAARNFFVRLRHPLLGNQILDRSALWPRNEKPDGWKAAPLPGEGNSYVFVNLLGHSKAELQQWQEKGIVEYWQQ